MSRHEGYINGSVTVPIVYQPFCICGAVGEITDSRAEADDWVEHHVRDAVRALIHRTSRVPSLEDQAHWFRRRAEDETDPKLKAQWEGLAAELEYRLGEDTRTEQPALFEEQP